MDTHVFRLTEAQWRGISDVDVGVGKGDTSSLHVDDLNDCSV